MPATVFTGSSCDRTAQPYQLGEETLHGDTLPVGPQCADRLLDRPCPADLQIQRLRAREPLGVVVGSAFVAEEPQVIGAGQRGLVALLEKRAMLCFRTVSTVLVISRMI